MNQFKEKYKVTQSPKINNVDINEMPTFYPVYDINKNELGRINKDYELIEQNYLKGVTCIVFNEKGEILFERRTNKGLTPKKLDFVSGHLEYGETSMQAIEN